MSGLVQGGPTVDTVETTDDVAVDPGAVDPAAVDPAAVELARSAVAAEGTQPGEHLRAVAEGDSAVAYYFNADLPGYRGWQWCVVLASAPGVDETTISEVVLLPGDDALLAPAWVPWSARVASGDLGPGDELAADVDDPRLVPNQVDAADDNHVQRDGVEIFVDEDVAGDDIGQVAGELGLGRRRLLSREGRDDAAQRWYDGEFGPASEMARSAQFHCASCGFFIPIAGALRPAFGICANEFAADGRAVSADYGCGAHSDVKPPKGGEGSPAYDAYDDGAVEIVAAPTRAPQPADAAPATDAVAAEAPVTNSAAAKQAPADSVPAQ